MTSSSAFLPSPVVDRRGCQRARWLVAAGCLLALAALAQGGLPAPLTGLAGLLILFQAAVAWRRTSPRSRHQVARLEALPDGRFRVGFGHAPDTLVTATLVSSWVLPGLAIGLAVVDEDSRRAEALLWRPGLPPEAWRRLLVRLRHAPADRRRFT